MIEYFVPSIFSVLYPRSWELWSYWKSETGYKPLIVLLSLMELSEGFFFLFLLLLKAILDGIFYYNVSIHSSLKLKFQSSISNNSRHIIPCGHHSLDPQILTPCTKPLEIWVTFQQYLFLPADNRMMIQIYTRLCEMNQDLCSAVVR